MATMFKKNELSESFIEGYSRVYNIQVRHKWPDLSDSSTKDYEAMRSDWEVVGDTIREETRNYANGIRRCGDKRESELYTCSK